MKETILVPMTIWRGPNGNIDSIDIDFKNNPIQEIFPQELVETNDVYCEIGRKEHGIMWLEIFPRMTGNFSQPYWVENGKATLIERRKANTEE